MVSFQFLFKHYMCYPCSINIQVCKLLKYDSLIFIWFPHIFWQDCCQHAFSVTLWPSTLICYIHAFLFICITNSLYRHMLIIVLSVIVCTHTHYVSQLYVYIEVIQLETTIFYKYIVKNVFIYYFSSNFHQIIQTLKMPLLYLCYKYNYSQSFR